MPAAAPPKIGADDHRRRARRQAFEARKPVGEIVRPRPADRSFALTLSSVVFGFDPQHDPGQPLAGRRRDPLVERELAVRRRQRAGDRTGPRA